jgi:hypothetical protein
MQVEAVAPLVLPSCVTTHQSSGLKHLFFAVEISNSFYFLFHLSINGIGVGSFYHHSTCIGVIMGFSSTLSGGFVNGFCDLIHVLQTGSHRTQHSSPLKTSQPSLHPDHLEPVQEEISLSPPELKVYSGSLQISPMKAKGPSLVVQIYSAGPDHVVARSPYNEVSPYSMEFFLPL